jgi:hypothetical protein
MTVGQTLQVVRNGVPVGTLVVTNLASNRASGAAPDGSDLRVGDTIVFSPRESAPLEEAKPAPERKRGERSGHWLRDRGFRGRIGLHYLTLQDESGDGYGFSQPTLGLRLDGTEIGGSRFDASVDVRARRTYHTNAAEGAAEGRTRVYRLNLARRLAGDRVRVSLGRQISPSLSSVSIFDGLLAEAAPGRFSLGAFAGTQPDPVDYGYSTDVVEYGTYGRWQSRPGVRSRWMLTGGIVSSSAGGTSNRTYTFLQARLNGPRLHGYLLQEVDFNAGWKTDMGEDGVSPTSTVATVRYKAAEWVSVYSGFDNRRRVRLYRDRETPETAFDDGYRLGWNGGTDLRPSKRLTVGLGARTSDGASAGSSHSYTMTLRARLGRVLQTASSRYTRYATPHSEGWLSALSVGGGLGSRHHLQLHAGIRDEDRMGAETSHTVSRWIGFDADLGVARGLYLLLSAEITRSDVENNNQTFSGLSYRF